MVVFSFLQVVNQLPMPTGLCHSVLLADVNDSDGEDTIESPHAPECSPISDIAENRLDGETVIQDTNEDDQEPQTETESDVSNLPLHV